MQAITGQPPRFNDARWAVTRALPAGSHRFESLPELLETEMTVLAERFSRHDHDRAKVPQAGQWKDEEKSIHLRTEADPIVRELPVDLDIADETLVAIGGARERQSGELTNRAVGSVSAEYPS